MGDGLGNELGRAEDVGMAKGAHRLACECECLGHEACVAVANDGVEVLSSVGSEGHAVWRVRHYQVGGTLRQFGEDVPAVTEIEGYAIARVVGLAHVVSFAAATYFRTSPP
jgi:hypothetical protein